MSKFVKNGASPLPDPRRQQFESNSLVVISTLSSTSTIRRESSLFDKALKELNKSLLALAKSVLNSVHPRSHRDELSEEARQIWQNLMLAKGFHSYLTRGNGRPFSPYAVRSLYNICMSLLRGQSRLSILSEMEEFSDPDSNPVKAVETEEIRQAIKAAMKNLPPNIRKALELTYWHDLSNREAAERMKSNPRTIATWNHRGRQILKEDLQKRGYWPL